MRKALLKHIDSIWTIGTEAVPMVVAIVIAVTAAVLLAHL